MGNDKRIIKINFLFSHRALLISLKLGPSKTPF